MPLKGTRSARMILEPQRKLGLWLTPMKLLMRLCCAQHKPIYVELELMLSSRGTVAE